MPVQFHFSCELGVSPARKLLRTRRPTRDTLILTIFGLDMVISLHHTTNVFWSKLITGQIERVGEQKVILLATLPVGLRVLAVQISAADQQPGLQLQTCLERC
jgi:hypothetical protein